MLWLCYALLRAKSVMLPWRYARYRNYDTGALRYCRRAMLMPFAVAQRRRAAATCCHATLRRATNAVADARAEVAGERRARWRHVCRVNTRHNSTCASARLAHATRKAMRCYDYLRCCLRLFSLLPRRCHAIDAAIVAISYAAAVIYACHIADTPCLFSAMPCCCCLLPC